MRNIFRKGRPTNFKLGTQREHGHVSPTSAMTYKVKVSRGASGRCWPISRKQNVLETAKLEGRLPTPWSIIHTSFKVKVTRPINAEIQKFHIFRSGRHAGTQIYCNDDCCFN